VGKERFSLGMLRAVNSDRRGKKMDAWTSSLIAGFIMGSSLVWLASLINDRYLRREKDVSRLILKRAKKG
jgi:hypothetical protein